MGKENARKDQEYERAPFLMTVDETSQELQTSVETGLGGAKVNELQQKFGPNTLVGEGGVKWYALLGKQISNAMIMVRPHSLILFLLLLCYPPPSLLLCERVSGITNSLITVNPITSFLTTLFLHVLHHFQAFILGAWFTYSSGLEAGSYSATMEHALAISSLSGLWFGRLLCRGYFTLGFWLLRLINYGLTALHASTSSFAMSL